MAWLWLGLAKATAFGRKNNLLIIELGELSLPFKFSNLTDKVHGLFHNVLFAKDFVLLESLTGDVTSKIFRVNDTLDNLKSSYLGMGSSLSSMMNTQQM